MAVAIIYILCFLPANIFGQSVLKAKSNEVEPIEKFTFLVDAHKFITASKVRLEQMDILIGLDFPETTWKIIIDDYDLVLKAFVALEFFKNPTIREEYAALCLIGQGKFSQFHQHMKECFKFKEEVAIDTPINLCSKTPIEIKEENLRRELQNIKNRYKYIQPTWTPEQIQTSVEAQNILFEFCSYYNDFSMIYEQLAAEMLTAFEELSDGIYPEVLFGELVRDCNFSVNGDGEKYQVVGCNKNNKGYRCQIEITQATGLKEYIRSYPVHYENIALRGYTDNDCMGKTVDVHELKFLDCDDSHSGDYAVCTEREVPEVCRKALAYNDITSAIHHCNFTRADPPVGIVLPHGGILIQGESTTILNGETSISQSPPIAIYSPEIVTIKREEEDYVFPPAIKIDKLAIVESKLTQSDIDYLVATFNREDFWDSFGIDDYIRYALILVQLIIFPIAIIGCYFTVTQRKLLTKMKETPKRKKQENFRSNQYLLRKI